MGTGREPCATFIAASPFRERPSRTIILPLAEPADFEPKLSVEEPRKGDAFGFGRKDGVDVGVGNREDASRFGARGMSVARAG